MLDLIGRPFRCCDGRSRRSFLKAGFLGLAGLSLPDFLRARAMAEAAGRAPADDLSIILVWLDGGPPQHETYDPKPDAPVDIRGPLKPMETRVPGIRVSELLPEHARLMDKMSVIRSMHHNNGDHFAAAHWMLTGFLGSNASNLAPQYPSAASIIAKVKGAKRPGMPAYVGLPNTHSVGLVPGYHGAAYLGVAYNPFSADGDPNSDGYRVPNLALVGGVDVGRLDGRRGLLHAFDTARRDADASGLMDGLDRFGQEAFAMVSGPAARAAFDLTKESPRLRDRYGRHQWGQSALMARRLVGAGVRHVHQHAAGLLRRLVPHRRLDPARGPARLLQHQGPPPAHAVHRVPVQAQLLLRPRVPGLDRADRVDRERDLVGAERPGSEAGAGCHGLPMIRIAARPGGRGPPRYTSLYKIM